MDLGDDDLAHIERLIATKTGRFKALEIQAAQYGIACPAHITVEMNQLRQEIAALQAQLTPDDPDTRRRRQRDQHTGPWRCDRCGAMTLMLVSGTLTSKGLEKSFIHARCGGEWWPG